MQYQNTDAWTWEHLALTRARVISGSCRSYVNAVETLRSTKVLTQPHDRAVVAAAVHDMRASDLVGKRH